MATVLLMSMFVIFANIVVGAIAVKPPNIVLILTDDQDVALFGQYPMPKTKQLIADAGMTFTNMFVSSPLCCPSRSSILTGQFVHNHMVTNNSQSGNCSSTSWQSSAEKKTFPVYLQANGYKTFFAGKYLNEYGSPQAGGVAHVPPGWDDWNGLVGNSVYYNYTLSVQGLAESHGDNYQQDYLTDVIHRKAVNFLNSVSSRKPFFMMLSTPACHQPFTSAPQYLQNFTDRKAPRTKHFNIHGKDKHWLVEKTITPMPNDTIELIDDFFRNRWRTLLSVDDMVEGVVNKLKAIGELNNTYIFFTSDNGYHLGQFSLPYDKRQFYDFDIQVPLMVRGPGVKTNSTCQELVMSVDLAPTFLNIGKIGQSTLDNFDGMTFLNLLTTSHFPYLDAKEIKATSNNSSPDVTDSYFIDEQGFVKECSSWDAARALCVSWHAAKRTVRHTIGFRESVLIEYFGEHVNDIPGCPSYENQGLSESVMSVDLAPTILDLANLPPPSVFDGSTFKPILRGQPHTYRATVLVEYHGEQVDLINNCPKYNGQGLAQCDTHCVCRDSWNNTYGCIRYETQQNSYKYCALQDTDNFVEVYDLRADPYELINIAKTASPDLLTKLSQDLADLSMCAGETCHKKSSSSFNIN
ncbi:N-acetylglucosamine-6-sulfatase isoform X1 [Biomphalaria glabrata]|nr:N-acetylglucosamine-6-sulfatase isoform X1 [Biomphalaria glabrata]